MFLTWFRSRLMLRLWFAASRLIIASFLRLFTRIKRREKFEFLKIRLGLFILFLKKGTIRRRGCAEKLLMM